MKDSINKSSLTAREHKAYSLGFDYGFISGIVLGGGLGAIALLWRIYG